MRFFRKKAQAAIEYLMVVAIALFLLSPIILVGQDSIRDTQDYSDRLQVRETLDKITEAAKLVYAQGEPARITISVLLPGSITNATIVSQTLFYSVNNTGRTNDEVAYIDFPIQGQLPQTRGRHSVLVSAIGNYVNLTVLS